MIGTLAVQAARLSGCERVAAIDIDDGRLRLPRQLGATGAVSAGAGDPAAAVRELTAGRGTAVVLECLGTPETVGTAIAWARKGGTVVLVGNVTPAVEVPLQNLVTRQIPM